MNFDFGDNGGGNTQGGSPSTEPVVKTSVDINTGDEVIIIGGAEADKLETVGGGEPAKKTDDDKPAVTPKTDDDAGKGDDNKGNGLEVGTVVETDDAKYTVAPNGDLLNEDGTVFKASSEVQAWIDEQGTVEDANAISINNIQTLVGIELTDENDEPLVFDNTPEGVRDYVTAVLESQREEIQVEAINELYDKYPVLEDVLNYYVANGESLDGYNEVQDRSEVTIDQDNEAQQEAIIRTAWKESKRGDATDYIAYLKSSGLLYSNSQKELEFLQNRDKETKEEMATKAKEIADAEHEATVKYWSEVNKIVEGGVVAGYKIPDTIMVKRDGVNKAVTRKDFFNYMYQVDKNGSTQYQNDLAKQDANTKANDAILKAFVKFTGNGYSNLVDLAINEQKVKTVRINSSKGTSNSNIKVSKPVVTKPSAVKQSYDFGDD